MIPGSSEVKLKASGLLTKLYFAPQNVQGYKLAAGLLPTMLGHQPSDWLMSILTLNVAAKVKSMMP